MRGENVRSIFERASRQRSFKCSIDRSQSPLNNKIWPGSTSKEIESKTVVTTDDCCARPDCPGSFTVMGLVQLSMMRKSGLQRFTDDVCDDLHLQPSSPAMYFSVNVVWRKRLFLAVRDVVDSLSTLVATSAEERNAQSKVTSLLLTPF